ncbi:MAG: DUF2797 domain-containing protein, partial [Pseudomonadota bacterium]|nr:DUF2797 domain-containing protein [Pseudomonadota bacterium]
AYALPLDGAPHPLNRCLGAELQLAFDGEVFCTACGRKTTKSFNQGYCYPCFRSLAACDICIVRPERCHYADGTCREPEWGASHCMQPHVVYLALSSGLKVGITRQGQIPTRWIDQGAVRALPILATASRHLAGLVEVALAEYVSDKTSWQRMLKGDPEPLDLVDECRRLLDRTRTRIDALNETFRGGIRYLPDARVTAIDYPVMRYPDRVKALNLDKTPVVRGRLIGIKGQYLILDSGVLNVRKFTGYRVALQVA